MRADLNTDDLTLDWPEAVATGPAPRRSAAPEARRGRQPSARDGTTPTADDTSLAEKRFPLSTLLRGLGAAVVVGAFVLYLFQGWRGGDDLTRALLLLGHTLALTAAGFGLGGVLTATGLGTPVEEGKQIVESEGRRYLLETPIWADFALIAARQADYVGNLEYSLTAHNFNPIMAMAAETVIAEPGLIVPVGVISPDAVKTPGMIVDHILERAG